MKIFGKFKERIKRNRPDKTFSERYGFKTLVLAVVSLVISVAFAVFNGVIGVLERSVWYGALAAYYIMLILFRGGVIAALRACKKRYEGDGDKLALSQHKIHLASGAFLVITEVAMATAVAQMVMSAPPASSGEIMAIATAAYTFFKITTAIINLVKAKKYADPVSQSLRCLSFADACMSMVSLTVVLLTTFGGGDDDGFLLTMKACVGFAACAVVLALATVMIITSAKKLREEGKERK
ncbi:MAG: hypothetical protein NC033_06800 [Clostridiales bacterium]|nr:hypothetical protein [Clostridiales bacterium]